MKYLVLTAVLVLSLVGSAWALDEGSGTNGTQEIVVNVPDIFWLGWDYAPGDDVGDTVTFTLIEDNLGADLFLPSDDYLTVVTNKTGSEVKATRTTWSPAIAGSDGDFNLFVDWNGSGFAAVGAAPVTLWSGGYGYIHELPTYKLNGFGLEDDPDTYTTIVTYTMTHP